MNTKLLREIQQTFKEEPKRLDMEGWAHDSFGPEAPRCNTVGCIAGWAVLLKEHKKTETFQQARQRFYAEVKIKPRLNYCDRAQRLLKLERTQAYRLFYVNEWPDKFQRDYNRAETPRGRAKATIARIAHFIKTKGRE